jgi:hypothetical protein
VPDVAGLEDDIERVRRSLAKPGEPQTKHVGEAATTVVARLLGIALLGMDDGDARRVGRANGIPSVNSAVIVAEKVVRGELVRRPDTSRFECNVGRRRTR